MFKWKTKFVSAFIAFTLLFSVSAVPALAHGNGYVKPAKVKHEHKQNTNLETQAPVTTPSNPPLSCQQEQEVVKGVFFGLKKDLLVYALKYGGDAFEDVLSLLGVKNARILRENRYEIARYLDYIEDNFKSRLMNFMIRELGFSRSVADNISWAICQIIL